MQSGRKITMYGYFRSGASWRMRLYFNLRKVAYEAIHINLATGEQHADDYASINPAKVSSTWQYLWFSGCQQSRSLKATAKKFNLLNPWQFASTWRRLIQTRNQDFCQLALSIVSKCGESARLSMQACSRSETCQFCRKLAQPSGKNIRYHGYNGYRSAVLSSWKRRLQHLEEHTALVTKWRWPTAS